MKEVHQPKRSVAQKIIAQWPGFLGLLLIGLGLAIVGYAYKFPPHRLNIDIVAFFVGLGTVSLLYWAFAN